MEGCDHLRQQGLGLTGDPGGRRVCCFIWTWPFPPPHWLRASGLSTAFPHGWAKWSRLEPRGREMRVPVVEGRWAHPMIKAKGSVAPV